MIRFDTFQLFLNFIQVTFRFDIGPVFAQQETDIGPDETYPELYSKVAHIGADLLLKTLEKLPDSLSSGIPQDENNVTYGKTTVISLFLNELK